jgi:hypothetical protein
VDLAGRATALPPPDLAADDNKVVAFPASAKEVENDSGAPLVLQALRWFYTRLHLSEKDRRELWVKRGLTAAAVAALGFRSNSKSNKEILLEMGEHFPPALLGRVRAMERAQASWREALSESAVSWHGAGGKAR